MSIFILLDDLIEVTDCLIELLAVKVQNPFMKEQTIVFWELGAGLIDDLLGFIGCLELLLWLEVLIDHILDHTDRFEHFRISLSLDLLSSLLQIGDRLLIVITLHEQDGLADQQVVVAVDTQLLDRRRVNEIFLSLFKVIKNDVSISPILVDLSVDD